MSALGVIPTYLAEPNDLKVTMECLTSIKATAPGLEVQVIDDFSPARELVDELTAAIAGLESVSIIAKDENEGFSRTVNVGLRRALEEGRDAVLINADIEFIDVNWLPVMEATRGTDGELASIVGGLLLYPTGIIQHAGIFFSLLHRCFEHRYKFAPANLPEALQPFRCPVTGALQFIRHECLEEIGLYDETFRLGWEDVDYCIRAWQAKKQVIYQPKVRAFHFESLFRGRPSPKVKDWQDKSWLYFMQKHAQTSFAELLPEIE